MPQATATVNGVEVARSSTWEVVDGNIYVRTPQHQTPHRTAKPSLLDLTLPPQFPPDSVKKSHFTPTKTSTHCPYKGDASYYTVTTGKTEIEDAAWYYPEPIKGMEKIRGYVAFYKTKGDVTVGVEE